MSWWTADGKPWERWDFLDLDSEDRVKDLPNLLLPFEQKINPKG